MRDSDTTMPSELTDRSEQTGDDDDPTGGLRGRVRQFAARMTDRTRDGSLATLAGGALLVRAARTRGRNSRRAAVQALAGAGLLGVGVRQRRSTADSSLADQAAVVRHGVKRQTDTNPRGTGEEPEVETETDPETGRVQFSEDQMAGPRHEPHLEEGPEDPRLDDDSDTVEIDLSEAALADEASEATGPAPEQSQPASTEETEPERTPAEDPSHIGADEPSTSDSDDADVSGDPTARSGTDDPTADDDRIESDERVDEDETDEAWEADERDETAEPDEDGPDEAGDIA